MSKTRTFVGAVVLSLLAGEAYAGWNMGYPWGRTHNGNCYMVDANAQGSGGNWTLKATQPGSNGKKYNCGAIYSTTKVYVNSSHQGGASAWISAPTAYGTWPAFWLTTEGAWTG